MPEEMSYLDAVRESLTTMETHVVSEYTHNNDGILASVTKEPRYAMMMKPGSVAIVTSSEGVAQFYRETQAIFELVASRVVSQLATDWFVFLENVPTRRDIASGRSITLNTCTLFPKAADGIRGEFVWERYLDNREADLPRVENPATPVPLQAVRNLKIHSDHLARLSSRRIDDIVASLSEDCIWAVRNYLPDHDTSPMMKAEGQAAVYSYFEKLFDTWEFEEVSVLNRSVKDWYVFAEELYVVRARSGVEQGKRKQFRKASIYPITQVGRIQGELGYGTDLVDAISAPRSSVGRAFWLEPGVAVLEDGTLGRKDAR